jgi:UDP-glucose:(heptosyl)LPS alpha-1,3-glucosyltransferase
MPHHHAVDDFERNRQIPLRMKTPTVALIRQRYAHDGGAERFVSRALEALRSRDVRLTLITREWRGGEGFAVITCNPFYIGRLWRDWSFARAVCRRLEQESFDLVQSHERISCCDVYRAGDGVHREWLRQRARTQGALGRLATALNPYHYYVKAAEKRLFGSARLKAVICNSKMVKDEIRCYFGVAEEKLHVIYSGVDTRVFHPDLKRHRAAVRAQYVVPENAALFLCQFGFCTQNIDAAETSAARQHPLLVVGRQRLYYQAGSGWDSSRVQTARAGTFCSAAETWCCRHSMSLNAALRRGLRRALSQQVGGARKLMGRRKQFRVCARSRCEMRLLADREKAERIGKDARETVAGLHLETMSDKLLELYGSLLSRT